MVVKRLLLPTRKLAPRRFDIRISAPLQRRLSDKIRIAFHAACDEGAVVIAEILLKQLDQLVHHPPQLPAGLDRRRLERLTAPAERLANLVLWSRQTGEAQRDEP
jgi:hypothetical protein